MTDISEWLVGKGLVGIINLEVFTVEEVVTVDGQTLAAIQTIITTGSSKKLQYAFLMDIDRLRMNFLIFDGPKQAKAYVAEAEANAVNRGAELSAAQAARSAPNVVPMRPPRTPVTEAPPPDACA